MNHKPNRVWPWLCLTAVLGLAAYDVSKYPLEDRPARVRYLARWALIGVVAAIPAIVIFSLVMYEIIMRLPV